MHNVQLVSVSVRVIIGKNGRQRWKFQNTFDSSVCVVTNDLSTRTSKCMLYVTCRAFEFDISQAY